MPLKLNVGLSRKVGEANYGSRGATANIEMELDSSLIAEPAKLQDRIRQLFALARASVNEELNGGRAALATPNNGPGGNGHDAGNGRVNGNGSTQPNNGTRLATQSQVKAIHAIAKSRRFNVGDLVRNRFRIERPDDLSIKQASQLIDEMKKTADKNGG